MKRLNAAILACSVLSGLGGITTTMLWLNITPKDLRVTMPHAGWFALALGLYAISVIFAGYAWVRSRSAPTDYALPTKWPVLTLQKAWYAPSLPGSPETFRDKVRFTITVNDDVEVWAPLWESADVLAQMPLTAGIRREGPKGFRAEDWEPETGCLKLTSGQTFTGWIGLHPPFGQGLEVRVRMGKTGRLVFPLKLEGRLRYERVSL